MTKYEIMFIVKATQESADVKKTAENAKKILKENKDLVMLLSNTLIERETITKEQIDQLVRTGEITEEEFEIWVRSQIVTSPEIKLNLKLQL